MDILVPTSPCLILEPSPFHPLPYFTKNPAWEAYLDGTHDDIVTLETGDSATPSSSTVYEVALEDPLIQVLLTIETVGAYAVLVEHGSEEMLVVVTSPTGAVLEAGAEEGKDEEEDEDDTSVATGQQWVNALVASIVVSLCRCV